jgi:glycosyltransferase involved in cell wall biosynthesis
VAICAAGEIWGGVERFIVTLATGLRATGIDPPVVIFHDRELAAALRDQGIAVHVLEPRAKYDPRMLWELRVLLRQLRVNILHLHGYKASVIGGLAAQGLPIKCVKTEHGQLEPMPAWTGIASHGRLAANLFLERLTCRCRLDAQVFVSQDIQNRLGFAGSRMQREVIYNGIDPATAGSRAASRRADPPTPFTIGIVGRIDKVKGHAVLLEAMVRLRHLEDVQLHVFGVGPLEEQCKRQARDSALAGVVHFHGFVPEIHERIANLDLLVLPSLHEGLPYVLLEAMHLKVPVIASRVGGLGEAIEEGCGVLVEPHDPAALAEAIERLYRDGHLRARLASNAHAVVTRRFLSGEMVRRYRGLYEQLLRN